MKAQILALIPALFFVVEANAHSPIPKLGFKPKSTVSIEAYEKLFPPGFFPDALPASSDLHENILNQTPVKSQGNRGTCSIFSATGALESLIKYYWEEEKDLSENYLQFIVVSQMVKEAEEGSSTEINIPAISKFGIINESTWPYEEEDWTAKTLPADVKEKFRKRCKRLRGRSLKICKVGHLSPRWNIYRRTAKKVHKMFELEKLYQKVLFTRRQIKETLLEGKPVVLGLEFFYGAWNHRLMEKMKIGKRDIANWDAGIVGTPTKKDVKLSRKDEAGHSIVVVGYDDKKKVYYFKNSWGTDSFGWESDLAGEGKTAGYGSITYEYAHKYGTFFSVDYLE